MVSIKKGRMPRRWERRDMLGTLLLILLMALPFPASAAGIYRCRNAAGNWMFSDNPAHLPPDCRPVEKGMPKTGGGGLTIVPGPPQPSSSNETEQLLREQAFERRQEEGKVRTWKKEATDLAQAFQKAQAERIESMPPATVTKALGKMLETERRAEALRRDIDESSLSDSDRTFILRLLEPIPPPPAP